MNDGQNDCSLNRGNAWLGSLEFPEPLGLSEEAIHERLRIPVLGTVLESVVTGLCSTRSDGRPLSENVGILYARIRQDDVDEQW